MLRKILLPIFLLIGALATSSLNAATAENGVPLEHAPNRLNDLTALQRGAKLFVNYCLNCHSANEMRYSRLRDIGISEREVEKNLLFTAEKVGNTMTIAMRAEDAKQWFGVMPPDLSVEARARSADWLYTYLRSFYRDATRPTGWNNRVFENVGMPHVMWKLQGQRSVKLEGTNEEKKENQPGASAHKFSGYQQLTPGELSAVEYDSAVADLVAYLVWMAEPVQKTRKQLGVWVLLFLGLFSLLTWRLNAAYWKDIK